MVISSFVALCFSLLSALLFTCVVGDSLVKLNAPSIEGRTVKIPVTLDTMPGDIEKIGAVKLSYDYDNTKLTYTGVGTVHKYTLDGKLTSIKAVTVDTSVNAISETDFFSTVQTPDTISGAPEVTGIGVAPSSASVAEGAKVQLTATLYPEGATGTVTWSSSDTAAATVSATGEVTGVAAGTATITATCGTYTDTCAVTVTA